MFMHGRYGFGDAACHQQTSSAYLDCLVVDVLLLLSRGATLNASFSSVPIHVQLLSILLDHFRERVSLIEKESLCQTKM
jgi:hypothetical protein